MRLHITLKHHNHQAVSILDIPNLGDGHSAICSSPSLNGIRQQIAWVLRYTSISSGDSRNILRDLRITRRDSSEGRKYVLWAYHGNWSSMSGYYAGIIHVRQVQTRGHKRRQEKRREARRVVRVN